MNKRILTHKVNSQAKISESMSNDGMKKRGGGGGGGGGVICVTPRNLYRYKLGKIIMTGICIGISYGK